MCLGLSTTLASRVALFACLSLQAGAGSLAITPAPNAAPSAVLRRAPKNALSSAYRPAVPASNQPFPCFSFPLELCCYETGETFQLKLCCKMPERSGACLGVLERSCGSALDHISRWRWRRNSLSQALGCYQNEQMKIQITLMQYAESHLQYTP